MMALRAENLWVEKTAAGAPPLLRGIDLELPAGRITVLLGETGAGKTLLARALAGLLPAGLRVSRGRIQYRGRELGAGGSWDGIRGRKLFYAPQNAACFNPVLTLGRQLRECSRIGEGELAEMLSRLQFEDSGRILHSYPHALSGGENQRCLLALALASCAEVLILDEPTSENDALAQDACVGVLLEYQRARGLTVMMISHHLGFVKRVAQNLCVMSRGELVAAGDPQVVLCSPAHPYVREIAAYVSPD
jgi:peptide/nickel transport system ATP-binding protein